MPDFSATSAIRAQLVGAGAFVTFLGVAVLTPLFAGPSSLIGSPLQVLKMPGKLARRNAARNPKRTAATAAALMIGLALVALVSIMGSSIKESTNKVLDESLEAEFTVATGGFAPSFISPQVAADIAELPEVEVAAPIRLGQFRREDGSSSFVVGVDPECLEAVTDVGVTEGRWPRSAKGTSSSSET